MKGLHRQRTTHRDHDQAHHTAIHSLIIQSQENKKNLTFDTNYQSIRHVQLP